MHRQRRPRWRPQTHHASMACSRLCRPHHRRTCLLRYLQPAQHPTPLTRQPMDQPLGPRRCPHMPQQRHQPHCRRWHQLLCQRQHPRLDRRPAPQLHQLRRPVLDRPQRLVLVRQQHRQLFPRACPLPLLRASRRPCLPMHRQQRPRWRPRTHHASMACSRLARRLTSTAAAAVMLVRLV